MKDLLLFVIVAVTFSTVGFSLANMTDKETLTRKQTLNCALLRVGLVCQETTVHSWIESNKHKSLLEPPANTPKPQGTPATR